MVGKLQDELPGGHRGLAGVVCADMQVPSLCKGPEVAKLYLFPKCQHSCRWRPVLGQAGRPVQCTRAQWGVQGKSEPGMAAIEGVQGLLTNKSHACDRGGNSGHFQRQPQHEEHQNMHPPGHAGIDLGLCSSPSGEVVGRGQSNASRATAACALNKMGLQLPQACWAALAWGHGRGHVQRHWLLWWLLLLLRVCLHLLRLGGRPRISKVAASAATACVAALPRIAAAARPAEKAGDAAAQAAAALGPALAQAVPGPSGQEDEGAADGEEK